MSTVPGIKAMVQLMRPAQWPILTGQLAVGAILAVPGNRTGPGTAVLAAACLAWVVLLNGGTLAFNSAYDRDTGPVAYLRRPPQPPRWLARIAFAVMSAGALLGWVLVSPAFGAVTAGCVLLSVLYSHPASRWKSRPGLDLLVNMVGYGAGTTAAGILAGRAAWGGSAPGHLATGAAVLGFALLFGALYPVTQIYQLEQDLRRGDRTLATALGPVPALRLALGLSVGAAVCLLGTAGASGRSPGWLLPAALAGWVLHLLLWERAEPGLRSEDQQRAMYRALWLWAAIDATLVDAWLR